MTEFNGRIVHVRFDRTAMDEIDNPYSVKVFVGNIPWDANDDEIAMHFSSFPPRRLRVMQNMSGRSRGFALLHYDTYEEADHAIRVLNFTEIRGRQIQVSV
jgi:RNA recognition motif-containing protein